MCVCLTNTHTHTHIHTHTHTLPFPSFLPSFPLEAVCQTNFISISFSVSWTLGQESWSLLPGHFRYAPRGIQVLLPTSSRLLASARHQPHFDTFLCGCPFPCFLSYVSIHSSMFLLLSRFEVVLMYFPFSLLYVSYFYFIVVTHLLISSITPPNSVFHFTVLFVSYLSV